MNDLLTRVLKLLIVLIELLSNLYHWVVLKHGMRVDLISEKAKKNMKAKQRWRLFLKLTSFLYSVEASSILEEDFVADKCLIGSMGYD
jgi:hypothetical protein